MDVKDIRKELYRHLGKEGLRKREDEAPTLQKESSKGHGVAEATRRKRKRGASQRGKRQEHVLQGPVSNFKLSGFCVR